MSSARKAREKGCWFLVKINILPVSLCMNGITSYSLNRCNWEWNVFPYSVRQLPSLDIDKKSQLLAEFPSAHSMHAFFNTCSTSQAGLCDKTSSQQRENPMAFAPEFSPFMCVLFPQQTITYFLFASRHLSGNKKCFMFTTFFPYVFTPKSIMA